MIDHRNYIHNLNSCSKNIIAEHCTGIEEVLGSNPFQA